MATILLLQDATDLPGVHIELQAENGLLGLGNRLVICLSFGDSSQ